MKSVLAACWIVLIPAACIGVTAPDLSSRIRIDGRVDEYTDDEWILDDSTVFRESDHDSRWGAANDIWRIAATWDETYLYVAVEGAFHDSALMTFLEYTGGGVAELVSAGSLRRNIEFSSIYPNIIVIASRSSVDASVALVSLLDPLRYLDRSEYRSQFFQPPRGPGALEVALPWSRVFPNVGFVKLLSCITGGAGTGTGDAAPDPSRLLSSNQQAQAYLDNALTLTVDDNLDGEPDMGVMPRSETSFEFEQRTPAGADRNIALQLETNSFAPDEGEVLRLHINVSDCFVPQLLYVSCDVYSVSGERVRVLFHDEARMLQTGAEPPWDVWDGRDDRGEIVRGGMYVVTATSGASPGAVSSSAKESVAVVR